MMRETPHRDEHTPRRSARSRWTVALAIPVAVVASGALVWQSSYAAFSAQTQNTGNSWSTGTVSLSHTTHLEWDSVALDGGGSDIKCVTVTYSGSIAADVTLAVTDAADVADTLTPYLTLAVREASGTCATPGTWSASATMDPLANGSLGGTWAGATAAATRAYEFTITVDDVPAAQGKTAQATFVWTAQS